MIQLSLDASFRFYYVKVFSTSIKDKRSFLIFVLLVLRRKKKRDVKAAKK